MELRHLLSSNGAWKVKKTVLKKQTGNNKLVAKYNKLAEIIGSETFGLELWDICYAYKKEGYFTDVYDMYGLPHQEIKKRLKDKTGVMIITIPYKGTIQYHAVALKNNQVLDPGKGRRRLQDITRQSIHFFHIYKVF